jgi:Glycosyl hydrolase family 12
MHRAAPPPRPVRARPGWVGILAGVAAVALVVAGVLAVRHFIAPGSGSPDASDVARTRGLTGTTSPSGAVPAVLPSAAPTARPSASPAGRSKRHTSAPPPAPSSAPPAADASCTHPQFTTSDPTGGWTDGSYFVYNNMWNAAKYSVQQTLYACSFSNWYVVANMNNDSGDGAVKTYPNVHRDFSEPAISSLHTITSTFAEQSPHRGIYEDAYDIWLNGVATSGSTEVMVWTENFGQSPSGSLQGSASFGGRTYKVYRGGNYIAFVADSNFTSGTVNLLSIFDWIMSKGWIGSGSTLGQVDYGAELVSTGGSPATFRFTDFSVSAS